jgi:hypothetical protein
MLKRHLCDVEGCGATFTRSGSLTTHKRTHTKEKPYQCDVAGCGATFAKSGNLTDHARTHTGEKPYPCDVAGCGAAFAQSGNLTKHKRTHTGEKPFTCDFKGCGTAFPWLGDLTTHKRIHTGEKPFRCDVAGCGAAFTVSGNLTTHKRIHTGEKPYECNFNGCDAAFAQLGDLVKHKRTHTGEKPFRCDVEGCDAAFATSGSLTNHKRTHTGEKPFRCKFEGCDATFAQSAHLTGHKRSMHTPEGQARQKKQEQRIARALENAHIDYKREHTIDFRCMGDAAGSFARVDFLLLLHECVIFLEVDENQHKFGYCGIGCDMKRMAKVVESLALEGNDLPLVFLRYNPNAFTVDGKRRSVKITDRERALVALLNDGSHPLFVQARQRALTIQYMYYDIEDERPSVVYDPCYHASFRQCVTMPIM